MNKKGIISLLVVIVLVVVGFALWGGSNDGTVSNNNSGTTDGESEEITRDEFKPVTKDSTSGVLLTRLKSASVSASESGNKVALSNGTAKFSEGDVKGTITLGDIAVEKPINDTTYILTSLSVNTGGSGTFKYVVLFEYKDGELSDRSYALVGDRVNITGIRGDVVSGSDGKNQLVVSVSYLDHDKGEPLSAAPTVPRTKILVVENGVFNPAREINI